MGCGQWRPGPEFGTDAAAVDTVPDVIEVIPVAVVATPGIAVPDAVDANDPFFFLELDRRLHDDDDDDDDDDTVGVFSDAADAVADAAASVACWYSRHMLRIATFGTRISNGRTWPVLGDRAGSFGDNRANTPSMALRS